MKRLLLLSCILCVMIAQAQEPVDSLAMDSHWKTKGAASFLFNQSSFSNWLAGGENNFSGTIGINYDFNYKKEDWTWDNKIIASYGLVKTGSSEFSKKTDDRLEINSLLGKKAVGQWYYSGLVNFRTQFTKGYEYGNDSNGKEIRSEYTNIFSPAYLLFGPGMLWKKNDNLKVNLSPLASRLTFVDRHRTLPNYGYFGVKEGESVLYELGFNAALYYKFAPVANVSFENILSLYSNYLKDPQNVDLNYQLNILLKINKFLTTNISFQTIYDNDAYRGFQVRQVFGVAASYGF